MVEPSVEKTIQILKGLCGTYKSHYKLPYTDEALVAAANLSQQYIFHSIDSNSVKGFPKQPKDEIQRNLVCGKNVMIDTSIQSAYVKAIREAQTFIYIENQYFLGSSYNRDSFKDLGAHNLILMEIALKIANKIKQKERFCVYILIPMWPEGVQSSTSTQWILFWQLKTMQMMYGTIYKALEEAGLENEYEPHDYLNFFCLGYPELSDNENISNVAKPTQQNNPQVLIQKNKRFMIYVHSKGMIVDDEYVLMGSVNISQRPMEGTRDTEIAMGAYQPNHTWETRQSHPHGQVHDYRMSLWSEHIGSVEECFKQAESIERERNDYGQAMLVSMLIPTPYSINHSFHEEDVNMSFGSMQLHGLTLGKMMDLESIRHATTFFQWDP